MNQLLRRYWYVFFLLGVLLFSAALRFLTPQKPPPPKSQTTFNTYKGIIPGFSTVADVTGALGSPLNQEQTNKGALLNYQSSYPAFPTQIETQGTTVSVVKERVSPDKSKEYEKVIASLGNPEAIGYTTYLGDYFPLSIFASEGIALATHPQGDVFEVWRFAPMSIDVFFSTIGKEISGQAEGPEAAEAPVPDIPATTVTPRKK